MPRFLLVLAITITLSSRPAVANFAPDGELRLVCGTNLVIVTTTWKQKAANAVGAQGDDRSEITAGLVAPQAGKKAKYPEAWAFGWAYEETISVRDWLVLDRVNGTLKLSDSYVTCRKSSKAEHRQIVDAHNRKVMESKPERKF